MQFSFSQRDLIEDGRFENSSLDSINYLDKGKWFSFSKNEKEEKQIVGDEHQGTVAFMVFSEKPDVLNSFIGQWINSVSERGIYKVTFAARSMSLTGEQQINLYLRIKSDSTFNKFFAVGENSKDNALPIANIKLTSAWEYYSVKFDLSKTVTIGADKENGLKVSSACESDLKSFFVGFSSSTSNAQVRFTDVSMSILKQSSK